MFTIVLLVVKWRLKEHFLGAWFRHNVEQHLTSSGFWCFGKGEISERVDCECDTISIATLRLGHFTNGSINLNYELAQSVKKSSNSNNYNLNGARGCSCNVLLFKKNLKSMNVDGTNFILKENTRLLHPGECSAKKSYISVLSVAVLLVPHLTLSSTDVHYTHKPKNKLNWVSFMMHHIKY